MVGVTLENVTKRFGRVTALNGVNFEIKKGEFFFLLGPSGCGKTTLLRLIAGFYQPEGGRIFFDDREMTTVPPHERNTGMVFQNYALWPHMSVSKNVDYGLRVRKVSAEAREDRVRRALEMVQMEAYADRFPNQLSGGQQQRVALARALVIEPDVVLLDEPLSNLDARLRLEMREQIQHLQEEIGTTMIYVTHDQKEALSMADRVAVMQTGNVVQVGVPRELYSRPVSEFVADFIGEINLLPGEVSDIGPVIRIQTAVGTIQARAAYENVRRGDRVTCAVRPEALKLLEGEPGGSDNVVCGQVSDLIYLGDVEQYCVDLTDGTRFKLLDYDPVRRKARFGDRVRLRFSQDAVVILRDSGEPEC